MDELALSSRRRNARHPGFDGESALCGVRAGGSRTWQAKSAEIQRSPGLKHGVNVELVVVDGKHDVRVRFFERGVGETLSSGTGSCASAMAAMATGRAESPVRVHAPGGTQTVRREGERFSARAARLVCRGEFFLS